MEETKKRLYVEKDGFFTEASMLFMALAMVFRLIGSIGRWNDMQYLVTQVALPVFSGLLFLVCVLAFGKRAFWTTVIPVVFGVAFFIFRIMGVENEWQKVGCIVLYVVIAVLYAMAFSHKSLKWILAGILCAAFLVHVVLLDVPLLMDPENPVLFVDGMQEMSVLGIMLALMCISLAMRLPEKKAAAAPEETPEEARTEPEKTEPAEPAEEEHKPARLEFPKLSKEPRQKPAKEEPAKIEKPEEELAPKQPEPTPIDVLAEPAPACPVEDYPLTVETEQSEAEHS